MNFERKETRDLPASILRPPIAGSSPCGSSVGWLSPPTGNCYLLWRGRSGRRNGPCAFEYHLRTSVNTNVAFQKQKKYFKGKTVSIANVYYVPDSKDGTANERNGRCPYKAPYREVGHSNVGSVDHPPARYWNKAVVVVGAVAPEILARTVWSRCARPCHSGPNIRNGESRAIYQRNNAKQLKAFLSLATSFMSFFSAVAVVEHLFATRTSCYI